MSVINKEMLFRRRGAVVVPVAEAIVGKPVSGVASYAHLIVTAGMNLSNLGFRFSDDFIRSVFAAKVDDAVLATYLDETIEFVKKATGADRKYKPMYPDFPRQVMEASDFELYVNAISHYLGHWFGFRIMPDYTPSPRETLGVPDLSELTELRVVGFNDDELSLDAARAEFDAIFTSLLATKTSWGTKDFEDVEWFILNRSADEIAALIPEAVPNKENLAAAAKAVYGTELFATFLKAASTATDVLRIVVALSGGDVALSGIGVEKVRIKNFSRAVRRDILARLESIADGNSDRLIEDMLRNTALWKLLLHSLHVGEYAKRYPAVDEAASVVRANGKMGNERYQTFNSLVEAEIVALEHSKVFEANVVKTTQVVDLLAKRPGVFARRLDKILRETQDFNIVLDSFKSVAAQVATPVLWQLRAFYENRSMVSGKSPKLSRSFIPKGRAARIMYADNELPQLNKAVITQTLAVIDDALKAAYSTKEKIGKVYLDSELANYAVPFGMRSASKALNPVGRGTKGYFDKDADTLRFFIFWKDQENSRVDIDLSSMFLNDKFEPKGAITYYNLRDVGGVHSGDVTSAPNGAAEYIDVERSNLLKAGKRYIAMVITSYTGQTFDQLPEVFAGVMTRKGNSQKGEIFEPRTIHNAFDVTSPSRVAVPLVIDLQEGVFIWTDMTTTNTYAPINVVNNESVLGRAIRGIVEQNFVSLYDVFAANAIRGEIVSKPEDADVTVTINRGRVYINGAQVGTDQLLSDWI